MITAVIAAAGQGKRMQSDKNKVFLELAGQPVLVRSALNLSNTEIDNLVVVAAPEEVTEIEELLKSAEGLKPFIVVSGGSERQYSIMNALQAVPEESQIILVHDAARPLIDKAAIARLIEEVRQHKAAGVAVPVKDTIKRVDEGGFAVDTPPRSSLWAIQTPQGFDAALLRKAYHVAGKDGFLGTDDASLVERLGVPVKMVHGSYQNIKVTTPEDILIAEAFLAPEGEKTMQIPRVGMGYDVHALVKDRKLILGGVEIPYDFGLLGHSDADVLLHAIKDAMLGAAALGDIGRHFPDTDPAYKGVSSLFLLSKVREILSEHGYTVNNVDATIVAQKPKVAKFIPEMNTNIARTLGIKESQINVKATTTEGLGFTGRKEGIAAYAIVTII